MAKCILHERAFSIYEDVFDCGEMYQGQYTL
jgi:hypothetical protein